jgi:hypothetical protein
VTKYISSKDNATFEETVKAAELFQSSYNTLKPLLLFLNVNKGIYKINKCKELSFIHSTALDWAL